MYPVIFLLHIFYKHFVIKSFHLFFFSGKHESYFNVTSTILILRDEYQRERLHQWS